MVVWEIISDSKEPWCVPCVGMVGLVTGEIKGRTPSGVSVAEDDPPSSCDFSPGTLNLALQIKVLSAVSKFGSFPKIAKERLTIPSPSHC